MKKASARAVDDGATAPHLFHREKRASAENAWSARAAWGGPAPRAEKATKKRERRAQIRYGELR